MTNGNGTPRELGNRIIGYDEDPAQSGYLSTLNAGDRGGSQNLVIGRYHRRDLQARAGFF